MDLFSPLATSDPWLSSSGSRLEPEKSGMIWSLLSFDFFDFSEFREEFLECRDHIMKDFAYHNDQNE